MSKILPLFASVVLLGPDSTFFSSNHDEASHKSLLSPLCDWGKVNLCATESLLKEARSDTLTCSFRSIGRLLISPFVRPVEKLTALAGIGPMAITHVGASDDYKGSRITDTSWTYVLHAVLQYRLSIAHQSTYNVPLHFQIIYQYAPAHLSSGPDGSRAVRVQRC